MISKERLRELLEERAIIYRANDCVCELYLNEDDFDVTDKQLVFNYKFHKDLFFEDLFETEEEATEYLKYGNVTRTEKLELPMWKDVEELINEKGFAKYNLVINEYFECFFEIFGKYKKIRILNSKNAKALFFEELTRENYDKARDIAIRLWKGEE